MQAAKRIAKNTAILYVRMAVTVLISLYSTRLILGSLGTEDFGLFNVVGGLIAMLGFLNACMAEATQRFMSYAQGEGDIAKIKKIFNVSILLHFIIASCLLLFLEISGYFFLNYVLNIPPDRLHAAQAIYQFMIISTLFTVISVPYDAVINARENMFLFAILGIFESALKLIIAFAIFQAEGDKLILYGSLMAILSILLLFIRVYYCRKTYDECELAIKKHFDSKLMKELSVFAGWSLLGYSTGMMAFYGQGILLNIFFGTVANAAQGVATQVSGQLGTFAHILLRALNPTIAKSEGSGDRDAMIKTVMFGSKISYYLLIILYIPMIIEMPFILKLWLKDVPEFTVIFCQLLLVRNLVEQIFLTLVTAISAVGNIKKYQLIGAFISIFPLLVTYLVFDNGYPPYALYYVYILYSVAMAANILYFSNQLFQLPVNAFLYNVAFRCTLTTIICLVIAALPLLVLDPGLYRISAVSLLSLLSFLMIAWNIGLSAQERHDAGQLVNHFLSGYRPKFRRLINHYL
ncbi:hypothetical protein [Dyadobacter sp. CY323]|uniref:hypothetical protein n=1 Tax=Dyadobacter sp. CY323 TaxID=2907302 RepID=UPI001F485138|nr:hypothetical protein [Dyadobacter sp. CY323]MCE6991383.1 hypothetical protein [Dyadobacter sp. CY323]